MCTNCGVYADLSFCSLSFQCGKFFYLDGEGGGRNGRGVGGLALCGTCEERAQVICDLRMQVNVLNVRASQAELQLLDRRNEIAILRKELSESESRLRSVINASNARQQRGSTVAYSMGSRSTDFEKLQKFLNFLDSMIVHMSEDGRLCRPAAATQQLFRDAWRKLHPYESSVFALSVSDDYDLVRRLNLRWSQRRGLAQFLNSKNMHVFAGWNSVFKLHGQSVQQMSGMYALHTVSLEEPTATNTEPTEAEFVRVQSVKERIEYELNVFDCQCMSLMTCGNFNGEVWIGVAVDHGGEHTKMIATIMNTHCSNSPMFTMMLGCLAGSESHSNLKRCLEPLFRECQEMHEISYRGQPFPVRLFFVGDFKLLNAAYGLGPCSSKYPCILCKWRSGQDVTEVAEKRDLTSLEIDLATYQSLMSVATTERQKEEAREKAFSVVADCLVGIDLSQICMPFVHYALGMGIRLVTRLEAAAMTVDVRDLNSDLTVDTFENRSNVLDEKRSQMAQDNSRLLNEEREQSDATVLVSHLVAHTSTSAVVECASPFCVLDKKSQIKWRSAWRLIKCTDESAHGGACARRTHAICTFLCMNDGDLVKETDVHVCPVCKSEALATVLKRVRRRAASIDAERSRLEHKKVADDALIVSLEDVINCNGSRFRALRAQMAKFGAVRAKYYQPYNGRQIRRLFETSSIDALFESFGSSPDEHEDLSSAMEDFQRVMKFATRQFLSDAQLADLKVAVEKFKESYELVVPNCIKQIKFHSFCVHLYEFAEKWRMLGLWTEQPLEHLHHMLKVYLARFENIGNKGKRLLRAIVEREVDVHRLCELDPHQRNR